MLPKLWILEILFGAIASNVVALQFNRDLFGVFVSPYITQDRPLNSYSLEEVKHMLRTIKPYFSLISTFSMGVDSSCLKIGDLKPNSARENSTGIDGANLASTRHLTVADPNTNTSYPEEALVLVTSDDNKPFSVVVPGTGAAVQVAQMEAVEILPWDQCGSSAIIARAAAQLNLKDDQANFKVNIGITNYKFEDFDQTNATLKMETGYWEIENAIAAAADANKIFPKTVTALIIGNHLDPITEESLESNLNGILRARHALLGVGFRTSCSSELVEGSMSRIFQKILNSIDLLYCRSSPPRSQSQLAHSPNETAEALWIQFLSTKETIEKVNPKLLVILGDVKWPMDFNLDAVENAKKLTEFWQSLNSFSSKTSIQVHMADAFDDPFAIGAFYKSGLWGTNIGRNNSFELIPKFKNEWKS